MYLLMGLVALLTFDDCRRRPTLTLTPHNNNNKKPTAVDFSSHTISSASTDLNDEEWVDLTLILPMLLESTPPLAFPPLIIAKAKSSSSAKSRKRKEVRAHAHVPFPTSVAEGVQEDRPRHIPQMSTPHGRDGGRTRSGDVKGVIVPASDPGMAEPNDDPDGDDF